MTCKNCGRQMEDGHVFCPYCGTAQGVCAHCGAAVPEGGTFCPKCGRPAGVASAPAQQPLRQPAAQQPVPPQAQAQWAAPPPSPPQAQPPPPAPQQQPAKKKQGIVSKLISGVLALCVGVAILVGVIQVMGGWIYLMPGDDFTVFYGEDEPESFGTPLRFIEQSVYYHYDELTVWEQPLRLQVAGSPTEKDERALGLIVEAFNSIPGFPGITVDAADPNVFVCFAADKEEYWYLVETYTTSDRTDVKAFCQNSRQNGTFIRSVVVMEPGGRGAYRNSTLLHEMTHLLGFSGHVSNSDFPESIMNTARPPWGLSAMDAVAIRMVYNPALPRRITMAQLRDFYADKDVRDFYSPNDSQSAA